jgi:hypothetical protein
MEPHPLLLNLLTARRLLPLLATLLHLPAVHGNMLRQAVSVCQAGTCGRRWLKIGSVARAAEDRVTNMGVAAIRMPKHWVTRTSSCL